MSALEIEATITVGAFTVVASFTADPGITALFGPSGSGKSVTLAAIAGLIRPTAGNISIDARVVADPLQRIHLPTQRRHLGMVFQNPALLTHRSPLDNVALGVRDGNRAKRRDDATKWLARVHAHHLRTSSTSSLSGGEQQRIALARALAGQPRLLLLDEPFSALDLPTRTSLRQLVGELVAEHGITALIVTHDLEDITALADRVVMYEPGRTLATHDLQHQHPQQIARILGLRP